MIKFPQFAPYFEMLKIISFCASYAKTLAEMGKKPSENPDNNIIKPFPKKLPPLPIRKKKIVDVNFNFKDFINQLRINVP